MPKLTWGGRREGAGRKPLTPKPPTKSEGSAEANQKAEQTYIDGTSRGKLINLLADGGIHPFETLFAGFRHWDMMAREALTVKATITGTSDEDIKSRQSLDKAAGELFERSAKLAEKILPYIQPKLSSMEHVGTPPQQTNIGTINVILKSRIDSLADGAGKRQALIDNVGGGAGSPDIRLGFLEQARATAAHLESTDA